MYRLSNEEEIQSYIDLLEEFDKFCKRHDIHYYLAYGSMLGAIRHHGFIPWDNDIDIFMFRDQADKLIKASTELEETNYMVGVRKYYCDNVFSRIYFIDKTTYGENGLHKAGIHMDGFILNNIPSNIFQRLKFFYYDYLLIAKSLQDNQMKGIVKKFIVKIMKFISRRDSSEDIGEKYLKLLNSTDLNSKFVYIMRTPYGIKKYSKDIFDSSIQMKYESGEYPVPKGYHVFLTQTYGDYMTPPPPEKRTKQLDIVYKLEDGESIKHLDGLKPGRKDVV